MKTCRVEDNLVRELTTLSNKLNRLSPTWVRSEKAPGEIQERREVLQAEIKHHRAKGHDGNRCLSFDSRRAGALSPRRE
jgi:hypothetical protein